MGADLGTVLAMALWAGSNIEGNKDSGLEEKLGTVNWMCMEMVAGWGCIGVRVALRIQGVERKEDVGAQAADTDHVHSMDCIEALVAERAGP